MATVSERRKSGKMTKHSDTSRSTDSGVSGNAQMGARGSRESAHKFARQLIGTDDCVWKIQVHTSDGFKYLDESELAELIEAYAESECSRLASRVEELEKLIAKHSGCSRCNDSASGATSANESSEIRNTAVCPDCKTESGIISSTQDNYGSVQLLRCKNRLHYESN